MDINKPDWACLVTFKALRKNQLKAGQALRYDRRMPSGYEHAKVFVPSHVRVPSESEKNGLGALAEAFFSALFRTARSNDYLWVKGRWYTSGGDKITPPKEFRTTMRLDFWDGENYDFSPMPSDWKPKTWQSFLKKLWDTKFTFRL